jgi:phosphomannomutase
MAFLAKKHGLGVLKTWVGFAWLSDGVRRAWAGALPLSIKEGRSSPGQEKCDGGLYDTTGMTPDCRVNVATMEQSNGFSILGGPPINDRQMGANGHVLDKDGTLAALLTAEVARYAKRQGTDLLSLLAKHIYADDDVGLFVNYYEPDPLDGEYPGLRGSTKKRRILDAAETLYKSVERGDLVLGGRKVTSARKYWTGKYDAANGPGFPDEGLRFYFGCDTDHLTIRPSGTTNSLRFHVQLYGGVVKEERGAWQKRLALEAEARGVVDHVRSIIGASRQEGARY